MLLYVMSEHPSVSQTFVVTEAARLRAAGIPVVGYALRHGAAGESAASIDLVCPPPTWFQLLVAALTNIATLGAVARQARKDHASLPETIRLWLAQAHAAHAARHSRKAGVTHVHAHFLARPADVADALAWRLGCKWTATAHGGDVYAPKEPALLKRRLRGVAAVACASRSVEATLGRRARPTGIRTRVVRCGVDTRALEYPGSPRPREMRRLVTVGRLVPTKGHWTILASAFMLMRRDPSLHWTIVGDGPLFESLRQDPRYGELQPRLQLTGALDHACTLDVLRHQADVFVLPCEEDRRGHSDGIPVVLMEAMALGIIVVTTLVGGIGELVTPGETGFVVRQRSAPDLTRTLQDVMYSYPSAGLDRVRRAARDKVIHEFDATREAESLAELLTPYLARAFETGAGGVHEQMRITR